MIRTTIRWIAAVATLALCGMTIWGQTQVHLATQGKAVNFGQKDATVPWQAGLLLPATCEAGSSFFKLDASTGQNLHICVSPNSWVPVGNEYGVGTTKIQGNDVGPGSPAGLAQFYGWDPVTQKLELFTPGALLSMVGRTLNVATDSVAQYGFGTVVPETCSHVGTFYFDTDAPGGGKLYYCNGASYEAVQPSASGGLGDPSEDGLVKRIGPFVTMAAVPGVDYYAPGMSISAEDLPNPTVTEGGKVRAKACGGSAFVNAINLDGSVDCLQGSTGARLMDPGAAGLVKRTVPEVSVVAQPGVDYYAPGTAIAAADLPEPTELAGGKVRAKLCAAGEFVSSINTDGSVNCLPAATGLRLRDPGEDGLLKRTGPETTVAAQAGVDYYAPGGGIASADLPAPTAVEGGKIRAVTCAAGEFIRSVNGDSTSTCGAPEVDHKITAPDTADGALKYLRRDSANAAWELATITGPAVRDNLRQNNGVLDWDATDVSTLWEYDDFRWGTLVATSITNSRLAWAISAVGTSTATVNRQPSLWPNLGIVRVATGTVAAGNGNSMLMSGGDTIAWGQNTDRDWRAVWIFRMNQTANARFYIGMASGGNSVPLNGFGIRFDTNAAAKCGGADASFKFFAFNSAGPSDGCVDSGVAADTGFHTFVFRSDGVTNQKVWFSLDGGPEKSICPSGCDATASFTLSALYPALILVADNSGSNSSVSADLDTYAVRARLSSNKNDRNP